MQANQLKIGVNTNERVNFNPQRQAEEDFFAMISSINDEKFIVEEGGYSPNTNEHKS
jgi:hypothetical protein